MRLGTPQSSAPTLVPACHHLTVVTLLATGIVLKDLFVRNYRPSGAEGSGRLLFARRSRATAEDGFSYQGQLRAADLLVSEASFFEPLVHRTVHRAASLASGHVSLTSNDVRVLGAFLAQRAPCPPCWGCKRCSVHLQPPFLLATSTRWRAVLPPWLRQAPCSSRATCAPIRCRLACSRPFLLGLEFLVFCCAGKT